jgi:general secretion pathway protein A
VLTGELLHERNVRGCNMHYEDYWGLQEAPFENVPDPRYYFPSVKHESARQRLRYGIQGRKGAVMLTGEIGCGKTLLSRELIVSLPRSQYDIALVTNPALQAGDFLSEVLYQFGIEPAGSKAEQVRRLNAKLLTNHEQGLETVLIVDEAQAIEDDHVFEDLRLLLNFQLNYRFLLTLVLMGQPELKARAERNPQLNQRISVRYHLAPFNAEETRDYIVTRMMTAGCRHEVFTKDAICRIYEHTCGVCRLINSLCDFCLLLGAIDKTERIDAGLVDQACQMV